MEDRISRRCRWLDHALLGVMTVFVALAMAFSVARSLQQQATIAEQQDQQQETIELLRGVCR